MSADHQDEYGERIKELIRLNHRQASKYRASFVAYRVLMSACFFCGGVILPLLIIAAFLGLLSGSQVVWAFAYVLLMVVGGFILSQVSYRYNEHYLSCKLNASLYEVFSQLYRQKSRKKTKVVRE